MMLLASWWLGCSPSMNLEAPTEVVEAPPSEGSLRIAAVPDRTARERARIRDASLPSTPLQLTECFGGPREAKKSAPTAPVVQQPAIRPEVGASAPPRQRRRAPERRKTRRDRGAMDDAPAAAAEPAPPPVAHEPAEEAVVGGAKRKEEEAADAAAPRGNEDANTVDRIRSSLDWGATVHLSNDDSMSLASAQRVLWAWSERRSVTPAEVRPHELLNYFSFDTAGPPEDQMFSVLGAAEQQGDTMTVSLAVRGANPPRQALDLTILLDRSCSMREEGRMDYTKRGLTLLTEQLQRGDRVDVVLFENRVCAPVTDFVVGRDDVGVLHDVIRKLRPVGGTNLDAGLQEAYRVQRAREAGDVHQRNRRVLLITDALLNQGNVNPSVVSQVAVAYEQDGIGLTGIGVGRDFHDRMLDLLTEKGKGAYVYLGSEAVVDRVFGAGFDSLTRTIAHDVRFSLDLPPSLAMRRFYGEEASTNPEDVQPIHYYADTTQLFLQDLTMRDGRPVRNDPVSLRISYRNAHTGEPEVQELRTTVGALLDGDSHNLRKGLALMRFSDTVLADAMRDDPCGEPLAAFAQQAELLSDDAEIAYVSGLVGQRCGVDLANVVGQGVEMKLTVDADQPVPEVSLSCGARTHVETLSASDTVARFRGVRPGACTLTLQGQVPMRVAIDVPEVDGAVRCRVRGGRVSCG